MRESGGRAGRAGRAGRMPWPVALIALATAAAGFVTVVAPQPTEAAWQTTRTLAVSAQATAVTPPTALTCGAASGLLSGSVPLTWTAPAGTTPSGYTLKWTGAATGSNTWSGTSGSVPASALLGTLTVTVHADYGSWQSAAGTQTRTLTILLGGVYWGCA